MATILIIDDHEAFRILIRKILSRDGHEVKEAENGKSGLRLYQRDPTPIVITDIFMPEMDGLEFMREIREFNPEVKLVVISGGGMVRTKEAFLFAGELGADRVFTKPFEAREFQVAIRELLNE